MAEITDEQLQTMSDEEFEEAQALQDNTDVAIEEPVEDTKVEEPVSEGSDEEEIEDEETEEVTEDDEVVETEDDSLADTETLSEVDDEESHADEDTENVEVVTDKDTKDFNYEASFNELMKPLNVSGKEVQIKSQDDMRNLASMGIDYSRKMRDIKPLRAIGETLAQAGLMVDGQVNEAALTRLIDISKGNKEAMAQLMSEQDIDPLDMETENVQYTPTTEMVSDSVVALQDVEKELVNRGSVDSVVQELGKLDARSKQFFNESPANLLKLDNDIKSGAYGKIMGAVQYEKSLGRMGDMSDMEAYIQLASAEAPVQEEAPKPTPNKPSREKRKAAGISKRAPAKKTKQTEYDYVNMSDEEFEKHMLVQSQY